MKTPSRRSIRRKLNAILATTTLLALLLAAIALVVVDLRRELDDIREDLVTQADVVALTTAPALAFSDPRVAAENLSVLRAKQTVVAAALYDERGALFASYSRPDVEVTIRIPPKAQSSGVSVEGDWATTWRPVTLNRERVGTVWLQMRHERLRQALEYLGVLALIMGGSLAAALLLSNRLQRGLTAPILGISEVARKILRGETGDLRATRSSDDEVGELVDAFNAMLDELQRRSQTLEAANQALRSSEARYQLAVRGSSAGLWDWDMPARTMFYSPRFKALLGYTDEEFPDKPESIRSVLHPDDRSVVADAMRAHLRQRAPYQVECRLRDRAGRWRWFFVAGAALWDPTGQPFRMAGSVVEVTERKEAERVLQEANRAKDEFLATLAHELRNPLAPIRTGLEILTKDQANGPPSERARAMMERQLVHMIRLIDDLLDISRINSGKIRLEVSRIHLRPVLDSAIEISRPAVAAGGHALTVDLPGEDIELMGDPTRLAQALGNLLNNAAKFTNEGGSIRVTLEQESGQAVLRVRDDGIGIEPHQQSRIFELFVQADTSLERRQGGLGIGLTLVRSLVELHGGTVEVYSEGSGHGSEFTVRLPLAAPLPREAAPASAAPGSIPSKQRRVLVVDDNRDSAAMLALLLGQSGHEIQLAYDGIEGLEAAQRFRPDVILLDIGMPRLNGYDACRQLRTLPGCGSALIVAMTGWGQQEDRKRSAEAGFDAHLVKPLDPQALRELLACVPAAEAAD